MWTGIFLFLLKLGALKRIKYDFSTEAFIENMNLLAGADKEKIAHPDTLTYLAKKISPENISLIRTKMIARLIRMRCLERDRLLNTYYVIAIDATGYINFGYTRHCPKCITRTINGKTIYSHPVVEAKLISPRGLALSVETEFIENRKGSRVEDCEARAFYRLLKRLKKKFPQLKICLSLDALYAKKQVFELCKGYGWKYIITFKEGSMSSVYTEAMAIKSLQKENRGTCEKGGVKQKYAWATDIEYETHKLNVLECIEFKKNSIKGKRYLWLTNIEITQKNFKKIGNNGGRLRWKIENEGFNIQKNGGYGLEHIYSSHGTALKNFYLLLQIAHIINQLMEKGSLLRDRIKKVFGGIRNFTRRLLEGLRTKCIGPERLQSILSIPFQIRFDSS